MARKKKNKFYMSGNVAKAYGKGLKPLTKWTKKEILEKVEIWVKKNNPELNISALKKIEPTILRKHFLVCEETHDTHTYSPRTPFYGIDKEALNNLNDDAINTLIYQSDWQKAVNKETQEERKAPGERWKCEYSEWSGTKRYKKEKKIIATGTIKGCWFYTDDGKKKKVDSKYFTKLEKLDN